MAQNKKADSLFAALTTARPDTNKVNILLQIGDLFKNSNPDTAIYFHTQAKVLAGELKDDLKRLEAVRRTGWDHYVKGDNLIALGIFNEVLKYADSKDSDKRASFLKSRTLGNMGLVYSSQGDYSRALDCHLRALRLAESLGHKSSIATHLGNLGIVYASQSDYPKALDYYFRALKMAEETGHRQLLANTLGNIGNVFNDQRDYPKALDYYFKAVKMSEELGDKNGTARNMGNIGNVMYYQQHYPKALDYYSKALKMAEELGNKNEITRHYGDIGNVYYDQRNFSKALEYYFKALKLAEEIGSKDDIVAWSGSIGSSYIGTKNYKDAEKYLKKCLILSDSIGTLLWTRDFEMKYFLLDSILGNYKGALEHYRKYVIAKDSLMNEDDAKKQVRIEMNYEFDKKQAEEKAEQIRQDAVVREEKRRQEVVTYAISGFAFLLFILAIVIFRSLSISNRKNRIISTQKREVEHQKKMVEEKNKEITDSINYAERIQRSFLASKSHLDSHLFSSSRIQNYFIFFKPKDIVSGDFYWSATLRNGKFALATADSTGHGVPGAIMSLLNITSLEKAIETHTEPSAILNATRKIIIERLKKDGSAEGGKDGMDCSLCVYDFKNKKLQVAAANNSVWIVRNTGETIEIKADKMPVGKHDRQDTAFTLHETDLREGDVVYTLTDGFPDQFGGEKGKKFMIKNLREYLAGNAHLPMDTQKELLEKKFIEWKGGLEQVDDICIIGLRINSKG